jgi:hypothetical protein
MVLTFPPNSLLSSHIFTSLHLSSPLFASLRLSSPLFASLHLSSPLFTSLRLSSPLFTSFPLPLRSFLRAGKRGFGTTGWAESFPNQWMVSYLPNSLPSSIFSPILSSPFFTTSRNLSSLLEISPPLASLEAGKRGFEATGWAEPLNSHLFTSLFTSILPSRAYSSEIIHLYRFLFPQVGLNSLTVSSPSLLFSSPPLFVLFPSSPLLFSLPIISSPFIFPLSFWLIFEMIGLSTRGEESCGKIRPRTHSICTTKNDVTTRMMTRCGKSESWI